MKTEDRMLTVPDFMVVLLAIKDNPGMSISSLHYKTRITYSHIHHIKKLITRKNWVSIDVDGQKHIPTLTAQGEVIVQNILNLIASMDITKEEVYEYKLREKKGNHKEGEVFNDDAQSEADAGGNNED
jgi:predicted transcriptional regulator